MGYTEAMKVLFQHRGKVMKRDAQIMLVVRKDGARGKMAAEAFIDGKTSNEEDKQNFLRIMQLASTALLNEDTGELGVE